MGATKNFLPKRLAVATAVAMLGIGFTAPAFADTTEDLLKSLRAKGVLSQDEYDRLLQQERTESKNTALEQGNAANASADSVKKLADAFANTKISGKIFADFSTINAAYKPATGAHAYANENGIGTDVKRFYIDINHKFDDHWLADFVSDMHLGRGTNDNSGTSRTDLFVKKAYLQYKLNDAFFVRAGSADTPWIPYVESLYGNRYIENTVTDKVKVGNSADWGLHFGGKVANGLVGYALSAESGYGYSGSNKAGNGQSGNNQTGGYGLNHSKHVDFEGRVNVVPVTGLDLAVGYFNGFLGNDTQVFQSTAHHLKNATRVDLLANYALPGVFKVGGEWFSARNYAYTTAAAGVGAKATGYSFWASANITDKFSVFGRFDGVKPYSDAPSTFTTADDIKSKYFNFGVSYAATKGVDLSLVWKHEKDDGINAVNTLTAGNTPGIVANSAAANAVAGASTTVNEVGLFAQAAW